MATSMLILEIETILFSSQQVEIEFKLAMWGGYATRKHQNKTWAA